jgi:hypothetical protein
MSRFDDLRKSAGISPIGTTKKKEKSTLQSVNLSTRAVTPSAPEPMTPVSTRPVRPPQMVSLPSFDVTKSPLLQTISKQEPMQIEEKARQVPVLGSILKGLDIAAQKTEPLAALMRSFYTPGAGAANLAGLTRAAGTAVGKALPGLGATTAGKVGKAALTEGIVGAPLGAAQTQMISPDASVGELAKGAALGAAFGGVIGGAAPLVGKGVKALRDLAARRTGITEHLTQPTLTLPQGRGEARISAAMERSRLAPSEEPIISTGRVRTPEPIGLPEPTIGEPTRARVETRPNIYTQKLENLFETANQMKFTPGRELEELESLWSRLADPSDPNLSGLIDLAYPKQVSKVSPTSLSQARELQRAREVAGVPSRVKGLEERYQPFAGDVGLPRERVGFRQPQVEVIPPTRKFAPTGKKGKAEPTPISPTGAPQVSTEVPGAVQRAEVPTQPTSRQPGERAFFSNIEQGGLTPEVQARMSASEKRGYEQITNIETVNSANARIERIGVDRAEAQLLGKTKFKADDVATGMRLIQELQNAGQVERAVSVAEKVAKQLTEAGQTVQAASIWARLSPEGALLAAQRKVNRINENLLRGQAEVKLSPAQAQEITDAASAIQASGASKERAGTVMEIMERVRKGEEITAADKQTLADFVADAKRFIKTSDARPPRPASVPKEMQDTRVRDRVTSFLEAQEQAAKERLRAKGIQISSNPLDVWADYAYIGALKLAKGAIKFADFGEQMIKDFGEDVRPHLRNLYEKSQEILNQSTKKINEQVVSQAERVAEGFIKQKGNQLAPDDVNLIRDMSQKVSSLADKERRLASQDLQALMQSFEKAGVGRKLAAAQYISMLLNPLTQIRNVVGNEMMYRLERMTKLIGTPIDIAASKITGGPRTVSFKSGPAVWDDFFKPAKDYWSSVPEGARAGARGVSPEGLTTKYEIQGQAFRSKYNPMTYLEKALGASLQGFDYAAYTRATNQRLSEMAYLDALNKGIKGDDAIRNHMQTYMTNLDDATHNIAKDYGKFATLQDDSLLAQKIMGFRRGANVLSTFGASKEFGAGSLVVPFAKTPANLLLRGLDYSPAGIIKALKQTHDVLRNPNTDLTRADVINSVTRALMGTGMGAAAYWLADKGVIWGRSSKDPEVRKLMQASGVKDFQINGSAIMRVMQAIGTGGDIDKAAKLQSGDTLWGYQWAQPSSMPMAIGSNIYQSRKEEQGALQTAGEAALAGATTLLDSSVLSGIREIFQIPQSEDNVFKAVGMNLLKQLPSQFVPSMARQFNVLFDEKQRETMAMPEDTLGKITNYAESTIPGLAQRMPQKVSTLGEPQTRPNSIFDVFISPAARSEYKPTPESKLVIDLLNATGDKNLAPRAVSKYLSGKDVTTGEERKVNLTPEQYVELQKIVGQETAKRLSKINPDLPTDKKISAVIKAFDEAGKIGRNKLKKDIGLKPTK